MRRSRCNHTAAFKAKVAIAVLKGDETVAALAEKFDVYPNQITQWKPPLLENASGVFTADAEKQAVEPDLKGTRRNRYRKDLQLTRRTNKLHLDHPFAGACMLRDMLQLEKIAVGRKHISMLMKRIREACANRELSCMVYLQWLQVAVSKLTGFQDSEPGVGFGGFGTATWAGRRCRRLS